ncbi:MAG: methyltransferase domain-containing protein [Gemmatimonadota bacterium]|nr:methyltransferase domain-containing protein [Gemmatimonadota bacterium]MDQ8148096.1 methyltransferase domain-containing protein [Gemmatimonadota bacterium]MDQ8149888.1 methyltransferase domain-containing protein [Gemmatimonadota bacterium]MDQ8157702.1 methyltransferase domain-containing protein [Gemmatimonadota bacterium]MDQ8177421.1 methyltransferase domain-containing protein [Gemmatimonadota bacterium]
MRAELTDLDRRFVIARVDAIVSGAAVAIEKPRNADDLISEAEYARDERLPYWADLWPAAVVLSEHIATMPATVGARALELGCGLGLVTIAAMRAGYAVTATDYYDDALLFTARNALTATGQEPATRMVDWRALPEDLGTFDLVLAADVLYERPYAAIVAGVIDRALAPGGVALVADQGRVALAAFLEAAAALGLRHAVVRQERRRVVPAAPEGSEAHHQLTIYALRREAR